VAWYVVPLESRRIAGSPARRVAKPTNEPPAAMPIAAVWIVLVERFWRNARPTLDRFAVEMLTAFVESVSVWESIPVLVMFAVTPATLTLLDRKPFDTLTATLYAMSGTYASDL
jgi:hypothetical protein